LSLDPSSTAVFPPLLQLGVWKIDLFPGDEPVAFAARTALEPVEGPLLSAALIVRDEERFLPTCLRSLEGLADEVVVVDTGSRDRTVPLAEAAGARVFHRPWRDDFGAPRRFALAQCRGRWALQIDADESVRPFPRARLEALLRDPGAGAYYAAFRRRKGLTRNRQLKLFRRHPGLDYRGVVHENLQPYEVRQTLGRPLRDSGVEIDHAGYEGDPRPKAQRNLPLLRRRLKEEQVEGRRPAFLLLDLADASRTLGDESAFRENLREALEAVRATTSRHPTQVAVYARAAEASLDDGQTVDALLDEAETVSPGDPYLVWLRARSRLLARDRRTAVRTLEELAERPAPGPGWIGYDERLFGPAPSLVLGRIRADR